MCVPDWKFWSNKQHTLSDAHRLIVDRMIDLEFMPARAKQNQTSRARTKKKALDKELLGRRKPDDAYITQNGFTHKSIAIPMLLN